MDKPRVKSRFEILFAGVAAGGAIALLYFFAPTEHAFYPRCFFHSLTGLNCPGCGSLRAMHQLLHGNLTSAFVLNPLFILLLPFLGIFLTRYIIRATSGKSSKFVVPKIWVGLGLAGLVVFTVLRNLPFPDLTH